jgi:hypothetical protein
MGRVDGGVQCLQHPRLDGRVRLVDVAEVERSVVARLCRSSNEEDCDCLLSTEQALSRYVRSMLLQMCGYKQPIGPHEYGYQLQAGLL